VVRDARAKGQTIVFASTLRPRLWASEDDMTRTIMQAAAVSDIVLPSYDDEATFFGDSDIDATRNRYLSAGANSVIVKNGEGAVHYSHAGQTGVVHPTPASSVIDTTSAGDSFNAGVLVGMNSGLDIEDAINLGAHVAAQVISRKGALVTLPEGLVTHSGEGSK
jgi:2-dehydro-3-deoxygluconokinase